MDLEQGARLRQAYLARKSKETGLTQRILAADVGLDPSSISKMFSGQLAISVRAALDLANRLDCHPSLFHDSFKGYSEADLSDSLEVMRKYDLLDEDAQRAVNAVIESFFHK